MADTDDAEKHEAQRQLIDRMLDEMPQEVIRGLARARMQETVPIEEGRCRNCGKKIQRLIDGAWRHQTGERGCRAATFEPGDGWDDSIDKRLNATPTD